jgi:hypothetical protein
VLHQAPWIHSDLAMTIVFKEQMWIMGGWADGRLPTRSASNQVWSSRNGADWNQVTEAAGWSPRLAAAVVEFQGKMWILGGIEDYYFGNQKSLKNDVWSSSNGREWVLETMDGGWQPRAYHQVVVLGDRMYLFGGGNYVPEYEVHTDVWSSADGAHWERVTDSTPWHGRLWFSSAVYRNRMWLLGGWSNNPSQNWGDVWHSVDGREWKELKTDVTWKARHEHSTFVHQDRLWVAGGHAQPLSNEVWSLFLPSDWSPD